MGGVLVVAGRRRATGVRARARRGSLTTWHEWLMTGGCDGGGGGGMAASGWRERGVRYGRGREGRRGRGRGGGIRPLHEEGVLERAPAQAATGTSAAASVKAAWSVRLSGKAASSERSDSESLSVSSLSADWDGPDASQRESRSKGADSALPPSSREAASSSGAGSWPWAISVRAAVAAARTGAVAAAAVARTEARCTTKRRSCSSSRRALVEESSRRSSVSWSVLAACFSARSCSRSAASRAATSGLGVSGAKRSRGALAAADGLPPLASSSLEAPLLLLARAAPPATSGGRPSPSVGGAAAFAGRGRLRVMVFARAGDSRRKDGCDQMLLEVILLKEWAWSERVSEA
mmetsp:Transcript_19557/g.63492  ORF Transcript_19557/g.63492 Transcript_19557/m.63492 type:complete len:349 (-) Transcript_19557:210-1256(-)